MNRKIIVIDDKSTDGTIANVKNLHESQNNLRLIIREKQKGIGSALILGYNLAEGNVIISMDADLSHPPEKIPEFIDKIKKGYDEGI
ncbi:MAG: glycosyltransferase [Promethearchaeota archaeon]